MALRWGDLGKENPTELEPIWLQCPVCNKRGCSDCDGPRGVKLSGPITVPQWCWSVLTVADRYRRGVPPIAGGALDQTNWINQVCEFIDVERQTHLAALGPMAMLYG